MPHPLNNPIWQALTTTHEPFSLGNSLIARRYRPEMSPFGGIQEQSEAAYVAMADLVAPEEKVILFLETSATPSADWKLEHHSQIHQMVCEDLLPVEPSPLIEVLGESDIPAMLELTKLTNPGPFKERTCDFGTYLGLKIDGRLVAMAGERFRMPGYTEVSAVCTHPDFRGHGYAKIMVSAVSQHIIARGETPFLHVKLDNDPAIRVYEQLGFKKRILVYVAILRRIPAPRYSQV